MIKIKRTADFAVYSTKVPNPVADQEEIKQTVDYEFIDMYPIFPTIDLKDERVYNLDESSTVGWRDERFQFSNVHTFFHANEDNISNEAEISRLIMYAFGYCYAQSQLLQKQKVSFFSSFNILK